MANQWKGNEKLRKALRLYAVTDRNWLGGNTLYRQVEKALLGGVTCLQLREKRLNQEAFFKEALEMKELCARYQVPLLINDDVEVALRADADGVHLGPKDMRISDARKRLGNDKIIGASARTVEQALQAEQEGADYLGAGAVFGTATKTDTVPMPIERLQAICQAVRLPVVAIGGICSENLLELEGTGIAGAAVVSAIFAAEDIRKETENLWELAKRIAKG